MSAPKIRIKRPGLALRRHLRQFGFAFVWAPVKDLDGATGWVMLGVPPGGRVPMDCRPFRRDRHAFQNVALN